MRTITLLAFGSSLVATVLAGRAEASFPAGVWTKADKVTMLPDEANATEVLIHGVFLVWSGTGPVGGQWGNPGFELAREGYMYFVCPPGREATCRLEWTDLQNSIGRSCRGFGAQNEPRGTVRDDAVCPANPDKFPLGMGVVQGFLPCEELDRFVSSDAGVAACDAGLVKREAGVPSDAEADVSMGAGSGGTGGVSVAGSGGSGMPAGSGGSSGSTGGSHEAAGAPPVASSDDDGGCALVGRRRLSTTSISALALAALAFARRRRSRGERARS